MLRTYYNQVIRLHATSPSLKIVEQKFDHTSERIIFRVQLAGKNIFPKFTASEILQDMKLLNSFDLHDQKIILNASPESKAQTSQVYRYSVLAKTYDRSKKKFIFTIVENQNNETKLQYSASDLLKLPGGIESFDKTDIFQIGFEAGRESSYLN